MLCARRAKGALPIRTELSHIAQCSSLLTTNDDATTIVIAAAAAAAFPHTFRWQSLPTTFIAGNHESPSEFRALAWTDSSCLRACHTSPATSESEVSTVTILDLGGAIGMAEPGFDRRTFHDCWRGL